MSPVVAIVDDFGKPLSFARTRRPPPDEQAARARVVAQEAPDFDRESLEGPGNRAVQVAVWPPGGVTCTAAREHIKTLGGAPPVVYRVSKKVEVREGSH